MPLELVEKPVRNKASRGSALKTQLGSLKHGKPTASDRMFFTEQLSLLLETGTPLHAALKALRTELSALKPSGGEGLAVGAGPRLENGVEPLEPQGGGDAEDGLVDGEQLLEPVEGFRVGAEGEKRGGDALDQPPTHREPRLQVLLVEPGQ